MYNYNVYNYNIILLKPYLVLIICLILSVGLQIFRYGSGNWTPDMRRRYNLVDAVSRHTVQVIET